MSKKSHDYICEILISGVAHKIAKHTAADDDLSIEEWIEEAILNQAEAENVDIEAVLGLQCGGGDDLL